MNKKNLSGGDRNKQIRDKRISNNQVGAIFFFKQKTAYEVWLDWSSDVCSSDLGLVWAGVGCLGSASAGLNWLGLA